MRKGNRSPNMIQRIDNGKKVTCDSGYNWNWFYGRWQGTEKLQN
jgi:hypothetical protein